jgi:hypothetical protein
MIKIAELFNFLYDLDISTINGASIQIIDTLLSLSQHMWLLYKNKMGNVRAITYACFYV